MRIWKTLWAPAGLKRKRGRSQLAGNSAPGASPRDSGGSNTQGPAAAAFATGANNVATSLGKGLGPDSSRSGALGKSRQALVQLGTGLSGESSGPAPPT